MPFDRDSNRIVIAGASSLLGTEVKSLLEESRFAASDFRLLDEDLAAGILTAAGGEALVIQPVEEGSFARARFVFFAGSPGFTQANVAAAQQSGAKIIDLSGALAAQPGTVAWLPKIETLRSEAIARDAPAYAIPSVAATAAASLAFAFRSVGARSFSFLVLQSVSEAGRAGIEELESQTSQLLLMQGVGKPVFDSQVAFNTLDRFGPASSQRISTMRERIQAETLAVLAGRANSPALQVVHTPVFYGTTFSACATLDAGVTAEQVIQACKDSGFSITGEDAPSNVSAAGESSMQLATPVPDAAQSGTWWFWGAADNIRLPAVNAVKLADLLVSS